jgi:SAM-dependent methyltransferase
MRKQYLIFKHRGTNFECPICRYKGRDLYKVGIDIPILKEKMVVGGGCRNAGCFKCNSYDRERLLYIYLFHELDIKGKAHDLSILHIAPEHHLTTKLGGMKFKKYQCGDKYTTGYSYPEHVMDMDVTDIPFEDGAFDLVICNHVLEHIPDDQRAMREIFRVLKNGGQALLQVPFSMNSTETIEDFSITSPEEREQAFGQFDHVRIYGRNYFDRLRKVGFNVSTLNISMKYPKAGLNRNEELFVILKD